MEAANEKFAAFQAVVDPYLRKIFTNAPDFGSAGLTLIFYEGKIARIDISESVQRRVPPRVGGAS